jgi:NAD(P)-dependent dehydrogenase (short-subunit alcohol dehydrogenase family)
MSDREFSGEVALVTGAASGIGRATAVALGAAGAQVVAADIAPTDDVVAQISGTGGTAKGLVCDLSGRDGWKALLDQARGAFGPISILVHSASPRRLETQNVLAVTEDEWDAMVNTNLRSGFFLAREIARDMRVAGIRGRILFIASLHAHTPRNLPHYSASKAGQVMVVKELARALGPDGIRVNAIAPGAIPGGGFQGDFEALSRRIAMRRPGAPEDVAAGALALLSNRSGAYVTGVVLPVDGGLDAHNWIDPPDLG